MKPPFIGINMNYESCEDYRPSQPRFRDSYRIYTPYVDVIGKAGGIPILVPCLDNEDIRGEYVKRVDGFLLTGGDDYPPEAYHEDRRPETKVCHERRYTADLRLAKLVLAKGMPVLGICGGLQLINIVSGGKLIQHLETAESHRARSHTEDGEHHINIVPGTILARVFASTRIPVNSAHHQAVAPQHLESKLRVTAQADDGVIEAIESVERRFLVGVQWHPERIADAKHQKRLFGAFVRACA